MIDEVHYSLKLGDEGIKGKNWDEKEIAVQDYVSCQMPSSDPSSPARTSDDRRREARVFLRASMVASSQFQR